MDFIVSENITLFFVTETWLSESKNHTTAVIKLFGYKIYHNFRKTSVGGGVAIIYKPTVKLIKVSHNHEQSFESVSAKLKCSDNSWIFCCCVYRTGPLGSFLDDFDTFISDIFVKYDRFILCGDANIHLDDAQSQGAKRFTDIIESYGLHQIVVGPTHIAGHTLDFIASSHKVIKNNSTAIISDMDDFRTCDHYPLSFSLADIASNDDKKVIYF